MAELTAEAIKALMGKQRSDERNRSPFDEFRQQDIPAIILRLNQLNEGLGKMMENLKRIAQQVDKPPKITAEAKKGTATKAKSDKNDTNALRSIDKHLKDIKLFLKKTFKKNGLSGASDDKDVGLAKTKFEREKTDVKKEKEDAKVKSVPWLSLLFGGGALVAISKAFGFGAGAGVAGGVLSKLLPKLFKPFKLIARRIPIIGSLVSFYEAYQKFKAGGVDNIVFGIMDIAAGIAYAFPLVGTAIGLGIDVLQYFLKNKADEWKKQTGDTSFFGSLYNKLIEYLSETPYIKWMVGLGDKFMELWNDPSLDTFVGFFKHFGGYFKAIYDTFLMLSNSAGSALGLTDQSGNTQGLFQWIYDKVEEYVITPVKSFFTTVFEYIGGIFDSITDSVSDMILSVVNTFPETMGIRDRVKKMLGFPTGDVSKEVGKNQQQQLYRQESNRQTTERQNLLQDIKSRLGDLYPNQPNLQQLGSEQGMTIDQLKDRKKQLDEQLNQSIQKVPEAEKIPKAEKSYELESEKPIKVDNDNRSVSVQTIHYTTPESAGAVFGPGFSVMPKWGLGD